MRIRPFARIAAVTLCAALLAAGVSFAEDKTPLKIGGRSTSAGPRGMIEKYQPLMEYLSAKIGRPVEFQPVASIPEILRKLGSGEIDGVILGSSGGAQAIRDLGAVPVARPEKGGVSGYRGCIIVRRDGGLRKIEDLKGKRFDYVEEGTSAGYIYPRALLRGMKLDPDVFFGAATFAGRHDIAVMKVLNGESDGASVKEQDLEKLSRSDPRVAAEILVLGKSGPYPDGTLLFRKGTATATVKAIENALLGIEKDPEGKAALASAGADRYISTGKKDFAVLIREMSLLKK
jgi:phosphonate transport system substrate-binding protein